MTITFLSNFLNHHQLPFCLELLKKNDIKFYFVATQPIPDERIKLGYEDMNSKYDFVIKAYEGEKEYNKAIKLTKESDVLIYGDAPIKFVSDRLKDDSKITFRYSERLFKSGRWHVLSPRLIKQIIRNKFEHHSSKSYLLSASAYAGKDYNLIGLYKNKILKWGYFPEVQEYNIDKVIKNKNNHILWVGRFVEFKHPEKMVTLAKYLLAKGYNFRIDMIGIGPLEEKIKKLARNNNVDSNIIFHGSMPNQDVIKFMKLSSIFVFTSDYGEGWGAVLNEAMNNGCAVIASKRPGATPYLINHHKNGFLYKNDKELCLLTEELYNDKEKRNKLGTEAYGTLIEYWNCKNAVNNLFKQIESINYNNTIDCSIKNGPASIDNILL